MILKAYMVHEGTSVQDGCVLVFAYTRNQARYIGSDTIISWNGWGDYASTRAVRKPMFDKYAKGNNPYVIASNDELPDGASFFSDY